MKKLKALFPMLLVLALLIGSTPAAIAQDVSYPDNLDYEVYIPLTGYENTDSVADDAVVTQNISVAEQNAALAFWTRDRIMAAEAMPMMVIEDSESEEMGIEPEAYEELPVSFSPPGRASEGADNIASAAYAEDWAIAEMSAEEIVAFDAALDAEEAFYPAAADGTSELYTAYIANWLSAVQKVYPHKWIGRLSFTTPNGTSYCSATAISGNNFVTAAHCVYDTESRNKWYSNKVFTPAYRNGSAPYGSFATTNCTILTNWINLSGDYRIWWGKYDVAVCTVGKNSAGQTLNGAVGYAGRAWNWGYTRHVYNFGYAFRNIFKSYLLGAGMFLRTCSAETFYKSTDVRGMGCVWGPGISGGPWIDNTMLDSPKLFGNNGYQLGRVSGYVTGVNSGYILDKMNSYGARFTSSNFAPLCKARGC